MAKIGYSRTDNHGNEYELTGNKDVAGGYAGLDSTGKILSSQLPNSSLNQYMPLSVLGTGRLGLCALGMEYTILGYGRLGQTYLGG
jgi:hypothetical protein